MKKYPIKLNDGRELIASHIGLNHHANGRIHEDVISSYDKYFTNLDEVNIENVNGVIRHAIIGDISEAYKILRDNITSNVPRNFKEYIGCIQRTITTYFGHSSNDIKRFSYFPKDNNKEGKIGCVSDLAHKHVAMSIERAMVAHNLLLETGISSVFKVNGAIINGQEEVHAFNLITHDDKHYIFDSTIPKLFDYKLDPIICEIPEDVYLKMISPISDIGYSVETSYFNSLENKEFNIIYDAGRKDVYQVKNENTKKLVKHENI